MKQGFLIVATGKSTYGNLALNLCLSIRANSNYEVLLICTESAIEGITSQVKKYFHHIEIVPSDGHPMQEASRLKLKAYDYAVKYFDACIMLDADTIIIPGKDLSGWFAQKLDFTAYYHAVYDFENGKADRENTTFWCNPDKVKERWPRIQSKLPQINASWIFFTKSNNAHSIFNRALEIFHLQKESIDTYEIHLFRGFLNEEPCLNIACYMLNVELPNIPYRPLYLQVFSEVIDEVYIIHKFKAFSLAGDIKHDEVIIALYNKLSDYYRAQYGLTEQFHFLPNGKVGHHKAFLVDKSVFVPTKKQNFIASIYLVGSKVKWNNFSDTPNIKLLENWAISLKNTGLTGILFHNCFTKDEIQQFSSYPVHFSYCEMPDGHNSGLYRFELYNEFMEKYAQFIDGIFFTDSTDVEMLQNPFTHPKFDTQKIYVGVEPWTIETWVTKRGAGKLVCRVPEFQELLGDTLFIKNPVLNAGLIGGNIHIVSRLIAALAKKCGEVAHDAHFQDMPFINLLAYTKFRAKIVFGPQVNTIFAAYETNNKIAWIRHK